LKTKTSSLKKIIYLLKYCEEFIVNELIMNFNIDENINDKKNNIIYNYYPTILEFETEFKNF
jgi:hypothetical protein